MSNIKKPIKPQLNADLYDTHHITPLLDLISSASYLPVWFAFFVVPGGIGCIFWGEMIWYAMQFFLERREIGGS